ncbi:MAG: A/G-specific adenine glycosylase [Mitsuokella sp.]
MKKTPPITLEHTEMLAAIPSPLLRWYRAQKDDRSLPWRNAPAPYHVWLSEIMLQQTRASAAIPYYERFLAALPTIAALAACEDDALMKLWQGLGYYSRARNLKKAAQTIVAEYGGELPRDFECLLKLPGIGRYTGSAIGSIAFGFPLPAVDGNVLRVVSRVLASTFDIALPAVKRAIEQALAPHYPEGQAAGELNQAFMDLGATVCLPHGAPHCTRCPLARLCLAHDAGREQELPAKSASKKRRIEKLTVLRMEQDGTLALRKRPEKGLLAGLWELPHVDGHPTKKALLAYLGEQGFAVERIEKLPHARHIFSHIEWQMHGYRITLADNSLGVAEGMPAPLASSTMSVPLKRSDLRNDLVWASREALADRYSIPSAFSYFL